MTDEKVIFDGELVIASQDDRTVTGRLLPFGVIGKTNIGGFTVDANVLALPADPTALTLNIEHDREQPVGRSISVEERADGVYATYRVFDGPEGDAALADIATGKRRSLSMEAKGVVVRAGKAIAGRIFGAGLVEKPAFEGATVIASFNDVPESLLDPDHDNDLDAVVTVTTTTSETTTVTPVADDDNDAEGASETETNDMAEATVPETVHASAGSAPVKSETTKRLEQLEEQFKAFSGEAEKRKGITPEQAFSVMASIARGENVSDELKGQVFRSPESLFREAKAVYAAQTNIADPIENQNLAPQWAGEFWGRVVPRPRYTDLLNPKTLVSRKVLGFQWENLPSGAAWAGNGAEIHSGAVDAVQNTEFTSRYFAGGNTVSRENFDFGGGQAFTEWYFQYQAINVGQWLDGLARDALVEGTIDGGTTIIAGPNLTAAASVPSNIDAGTSALVDAVVAYYQARLELPDFVVMDPALYATMLKAPQTAVLGYLRAALNIPEGDVVGITVRPAKGSDLTQAKQASGTNGSGTNRTIKALAGGKQQVDIYQLPGSPFQAQVVNVANGLISLGAYAYALVLPMNQVGTELAAGLYGVY